MSGCYLPYEGTWTPLWDFATSRGVVTALKLKTEFKSNRQMLAAQEKIMKHVTEVLGLSVAKKKRAIWPWKPMTSRIAPIVSEGARKR